ncbi:hypothetical protein K402DRAFT_265767 [Aulographum hederae CBS 113979]|uniref:Uncharacterized protein n=1 Tax=Aulographum hederae CBS 113979 TaxID=1176131 RepID=A0A6G1GJ97_9PEZI|nr:hypothetical protein K402DRAFT_265767 [Aulographum hederae CBS 113979]
MSLAVRLRRSQAQRLVLVEQISCRPGLVGRAAPISLCRRPRSQVLAVTTSPFPTLQARFLSGLGPLLYSPVVVLGQASSLPPPNQFYKGLVQATPHPQTPSPHHVLSSFSATPPLSSSNPPPRV